MKQRWIIFAALGGSLAVHVVALSSLTALHPRLFSADLPDDTWRHEDQITVVLEDPEPKPPEPKPPVDWRDRMGESTGTGNAANRAEGLQPLKAREADQVQGFLSRDPVGQGRIHADPSRYTGPTGEGGTAGGAQAAPAVFESVPATAAPAGSTLKTPSPAGLEPRPPAALPDPLPPPQARVAELQVAPLAPELHLPTTQPSAPANHAAPSPRTTVAAAVPVRPAARPSQSPGDGRKVGLDRPSADPAQESDSESDPFTKVHDTITLRDGKVIPQLGRKVKTTVPRIGIAGQIALTELENPVLEFKVSIEPSGAVSDVQYVRKTGHVALDEPCKEAIFNWWFEPAKDKAGRPVPDVQLFTIAWR